MIVETSHGRIEGEEWAGVHVFRGVPYARASRWRPPAPAPSWPGLRPAQGFGPNAPQRDGPIAELLGARTGRADEDCLSLNVWMPGEARGRRPVMVWLHGGGFTSGAGSLDVYDGSALARRGDVVVVTLNYRLGALGFLYRPELAGREGEAPGNYALLDQLAALAWVRDNAGVFGGDPGRVTLFGQSAGAMCAATLLGVPRARGLFQRVILQSGAARNVHPPDTAARVTQTFCAEAGVRPDDHAALRALPVSAVLDAQQRTAERLGGELSDPPFQPVLDAELLPRAPLEAVAGGAARELAMLVGTNRDEWRFYGLRDPAASRLDEAGLLRRLRRGLPGRDRSGRCWADRAVECYRSARSGRASTHPRDLWFAIQTDRWFRHPAMQLAQAQAEQQPATHAYLFTWASPAFGGALGSCHALDLPFVFGAVEDPRLRAFVGEPAELRPLAARMQAAWLDFAHGEAPGGAGLPSWPAYQAGRRATMIFGPECGMLEAPDERERAFWDEVAAEHPSGGVRT